MLLKTLSVISNCPVFSIIPFSSVVSCGMILGWQYIGSVSSIVVFVIFNVFVLVIAFPIIVLKVVLIMFKFPPLSITQFVVLVNVKFIKVTCAFEAILKMLSCSNPLKVALLPIIVIFLFILTVSFKLDNMFILDKNMVSPFWANSIAFCIDFIELVHELLEWILLFILMELLVKLVSCVVCILSKDNTFEYTPNTNTVKPVLYCTWYGNVISHV